ncbi:MAG: DMT family transporter [Ignavibacteria bacterium]|nr:DMT family transporter [Ignavibacteria bacterium]
MNENNAKNKTINVSSFKAELILLFATISWGISFPAIKISLDYFDPITFVFIRFGLSLLLCLLIFYKHLHLLSYKYLKYGLILGVFLYIGSLSQTIGLKYTTASNSAFITGTNILLLPFIQVLIIKQKPKYENVIGIVVAFVGLYFLTGVHYSELNIGDFITFICAISFAIQIVLINYYLEKINFIPLLIGQFIAMTLLSPISLFLFSIIFNGEIYFKFNLVSISLLVFNVIFPTILSFTLATKYQKYTTPVKAGLIYNSEVFYAIIFAYIILGEIIQKNQIIGGALIITGILISEFLGELIKYIKK